MVLHTVVLVVLLDQRVHPRAEAQHFAQLLHLRAAPLVGLEEAEVLSYTPRDFALVDVLVVPGEQLACLSDVLGDGLLREDVLAGTQGGLDVSWLSGNRKASWRRSLVCGLVNRLRESYAIITPLISERARRSEKALPSPASSLYRSTPEKSEPSS